MRSTTAASRRMAIRVGRDHPLAPRDDYLCAERSVRGGHDRLLGVGSQYHGTMDEPKASPLAASAQAGKAPEKTGDAPTSPAGESPFARALTAATQGGTESTLARGSGHISASAPASREHSVMEGLPEAKKERIAAMRRELAEVQQQLIDAQQRV